MTEVLFYHLERARLETVLPDLLEKSMAKGWRALVLTGNSDLEPLDNLLWTYRDESFLPHATRKGSEDPTSEPIIIAQANEYKESEIPDCIPIQERINGAEIVFLVNGAATEISLLEPYERCVVIFDGRNEEALTNAREFWKTIKSSDQPQPTYWRQNGAGKWEKHA